MAAVRCKCNILRPLFVLNTNLRMEELRYGEQNVLLSVPGNRRLFRLYKIGCLWKGTPYGRFTGYAGLGDKRYFGSSGTFAGGKPECPG